MIRYVSIERSAADTAHAAASPPTNVGTRSRPRSSIGSAWMRSTAMNTARSAALAASAAITVVEPHPSLWLWIRPYTSAARPPLKVTHPAQSGRLALGFRDSSTQSSVIVSATIPIGTLT